MGHNAETPKSSASITRKYVAFAAILSVMVAGSFYWDTRQETRTVMSTAAAAARANIGKDLIFRRWATSHGGVYVPPTEHTPPNPYLKIPDRDVVTTTGKHLTLMNPAYMLREMQQDFLGEYGMQSHITSLKLLNPKNAPDPWETEALHAFEHGDRERSEAVQINGEPYLRLMRPLFIEKGCLKCHGSQGYKVGDIRGGLSTSIPLTNFLARRREQLTAQAWIDGTILLAGLLGLGFAYRGEHRQSEERLHAEAKLQATSLYTRSLIEASLDPLVTISPQGKITDVNAATEKATGMHRSELAGTDFSDYFTEPQKAREGYLQVFSRGFVTDYPLAIRHKDGHVTDVLYNASVYSDSKGKVLGVFAAARDVTELKKAEAEARALNQELEHRVDTRTQELEAANKELEAFSYSVSHDLRAPLRAINGFTHILEDEYSKKLDDEGRHLLDVVHDNAVRMEQLINDILQLSRVGRTELDVREVDMSALARDVYADLSRSLPGGVPEAEIGALPPAQGNATLLRQVFVNLISNAIKFSRNNPNPRIKISASVKPGENIYSVQDNGAGFDMHYADHLFGVFQRLHTTSEFEGTGIGLAIVKRIVTRHGGRVWAEGEVNAGATFYFALPASHLG